jgi:hypothetical protein
VNTGEGINAGIIFRMPIKECKKKAAAASLGYLAMDVLNPPKGTIWGQFNDRKVDEESLKTLVEKYKQDFLNCDEDTAMWVGIKKSWVKNVGEAKKTEELVGMDIDELPMLELTLEGGLGFKREGQEYSTLT